jgi:hypothetical protein
LRCTANVGGAFLTQITQNAGGQFPRRKIGQAIDSTILVPGHGEVDMPVWGERLGRESMRANVPPIEDYIRSIQAKWCVEIPQFVES